MYKASYNVIYTCIPVGLSLYRAKWGHVRAVNSFTSQLQLLTLHYVVKVPTALGIRTTIASRNIKLLICINFPE